MMNFLNATQDDILKINANGSHIVKWQVDAAFTVHPDYKSKTGAIMNMGKGAVQ